MKFSIYLSTCDAYSDCWYPFFKLFSQYWASFSGKIYLSSEYKTFSYELLDAEVIPLKVCEKNSISQKRRIPWSMFTRLALDLIPEDLILFMQEDFFLRDYVRAEEVEKFANFMNEHPEIKCLHLTDQCGNGSFPSQYPNLDEMLLKRPYRVSCQAAFWRKSELLRILRDYESAWEFEILGSSRSAAIGSSYLCVSHDYVKLGRYEIIPYVFTGIIKGKWKEEVQTVFAENNIIMDFTRRGFYNQSEYDTVRSSSNSIVTFYKRLRNKIDIVIAILVPKFLRRF